MFYFDFKKFFFRNYCALVTVLILVNTSCSYDKTELNLGSAFDSTWQFNSSNDYEFDDNLIQFKNGKVFLKPLDLEQSGNNFSSGNHAGSHLNSSNNLSLNQNLDIRKILPSQASDMKYYWKFDGSFKDVIANNGNYTGSGISTNFVASSKGYSLKLNGTDEALSILSDPFTQVSFSAWVKLDSYANDFPRIFSLGDDKMALWVSSSSKEINLRVRHDGNKGHWTSDNFTFNLDEWYHVFVSYDSTSNSNNPNILVNGQPLPLEEFHTPSGTILDTSIGASYLSSWHSAALRHWDGAFDELAFWDTALSNEQGVAIYNAQLQSFSSENHLHPSWTPHWDNIVGYWQMNENWQDSSGNGNHGSPYNEASFSSNAQVSGFAGTFDGTTDYVDLGNDASLDLTNNFTISSWFYSKAQSDKSIFGRYDGSINTGYQIGVRYTGGLNRIFVYHGDGTSNILWGPEYKLNRWYHLMVVREAGITKLYIDGKHYPVTTAGNISLPTFNAALGVRQINTPSISDFNGEIDDVAIWNKPLSPTDVSVIYNRQKQKYASHFDSEVIDLGNTTATWPDLSWSTSLPFGKELVGDFNNNGNPDNESIAHYSSVIEDLSDGLIGYWPLNEPIWTGSVDEVIDLSGVGNDGQAVNGATTNSSGKLNRGVSFDGVSQHITFQNTITLSTEGTLSGWFKFNDLTNIQHVVASGSSSSSTPIGTLLRIDTTGVISVFFRNAGSIIFNVIHGTTPLKKNQWYHIVTSSNGSEYKFYINGKEEPISVFTGTNDGSWLNILSSQDRFTIGALDRSSGQSHFFNGEADEIAIWSRFLSEDEIRQLYRRGANRVKLQVKSCVDSSCNCKSYNLAPAGSETDCDGDGTLNTLDTDDIHKAEFIGPGGDGTTYYSELYSRSSTDVTFNCSLNATDSDPGVCVEDEITIAGSSKPTGPEFLNIDYTQFITPSANRYAQYRVYMEADDNTACGGEPCLPELTAVSLNPSGAIKYASEYVEIKPKSPINFTTLSDASISADSCASFRLHRNPNSYYHDGASWVLVSDESHRNLASEVTTHIKQFATQFGAGELEVIGYLKSDPTQTNQCSIDEIDINFN